MMDEPRGNVTDLEARVKVAGGYAREHLAQTRELEECKEDVLDTTTTSRSTVFIINALTGKYHKALIDEGGHPPIAWRTHCGWNHGFAPFTRSSIIPKRASSAFERCLPLHATAPSDGDSDSTNSSESDSCTSGT